MKNLKKSIAVLMIMTFILTGCGKNENSVIEDNEEVGIEMEKNDFNPEVVKIIDDFTNAMKEFDLAAVLQYTTPAELDKNRINNAFPNDGIFKIELDYLKGNAKNIEYRIESIREEEDKAIAKVKYRYMDMSSVIESTLKEYAIELEEAENINQDEKNLLIEEIFQREIKESSPVYIEEIIKMDLIKIDNKWYVENLSKNLKNIMFSNYIKAFNKLDSSLS